MKVRDLITALLDFDMNGDVYIDAGDHDIVVVDTQKAYTRDVRLLPDEKVIKAEIVQ